MKSCSAAQRVPPAHDRDVEVRLEQHPVGLDVDRDQDEEAPHREEVGQPGDGPLQQLALPEHLGDLRPDPGADVVGAPGDRLSGHHQLVQPPDASQSQHAHDRGHAQAQNEPDDRLRGHRRSPQYTVIPASPYPSRA